MMEINGEQQSIVLSAVSILKRMTTFNPQQLMQFLAGSKGMPYPHCSRLNYFHVTSQRKQKKRLQTECNKTPVYTGQKRARQQDTPQSAKVLINKNYEKVFRVGSNDTEISNKQLKSKIRNLQQQLGRCNSKIANMSDVIDSLEQSLIVKTEIVDGLHASFDKLQLSIFNNTKNNTTISPCGRRYTDDIKEFSVTLYFYSPKAYEYVRSIIPLPNPSLIRK